LQGYEHQRRKGNEEAKGEMGIVKMGVQEGRKCKKERPHVEGNGMWRIKVSEQVQE
jgi:hypothetical protein